MLVLVLCSVVAGASTLSSSEAAKHVGENATVCGTVVGVHTATSSKGSPTFINLDKTYPHQVFTVLVWGSDVAKFSPAPAAWEGKQVCATGMITLYRGIPEIVAREAGQISFPR
jgi:DNA/RNA endonuclease YhcR with UshA esterase domain